MKGFLVSAVFPLLLLALLLAFGTRKGTDWEKNLLESADTVGMDDRLSSLSPERGDLVQGYQGQWGRYGLLLHPGREGHVSFVLYRAAGADWITVRLWAYDYGACRVKWWPEGDRDSAVTISAQGNLNGKIWRIKLPSNASRGILEVTGRNDTAQPQVLMHRISVSSSPFNPVRGWNGAFWIWGIVTALWLGFAAKRKWWSPPGGLKLWYAALLLLLIGATLRLDLLSSQNGLALDPDVESYRIYADQLKWFDADRGFYSAAFSEREPLWVAVINVWQGWVGTGDFSVRLLTCLLSLSVVVFSGILLWRFLEKGHWVIAGMSLVALNPSLIEESCRGLRSEAMTLFFVAFLMLSFQKKESWFSPLKAGLLGGAWALLQSPALSVVFGLWLVLWFMSFVGSRVSMRWEIPKGYSVPKILVAMTVSVALFGPHLYGLEKRHGDWRWPSNGYARWNANMEFPERLGTAGFPTVEEFEKNPYAGPPMSYGEYLFDLHTPFQLVKYQILGWMELTAYQALSLSAQSLKRLVFSAEASGGRFPGILMFLGPAMVLALLLGMIGLVAWFRLLLDKRLWWMPLLLLWGTYYVAFLYHVRLVEPLRHTMHTYPLLVLIMIWGVQGVYHRSRISELARHVRDRRLQK